MHFNLKKIKNRTKIEGSGQFFSEKRTVPPSVRRAYENIIKFTDFSQLLSHVYVMFELIQRG